MNATTEAVRPVDRWFAAYADDHRNPTNQLLHVICVPAIVWSLLAMLYVIPTPEFLRATLPQEGVIAGAAMGLALLFWLRMSWSLGVGILVLTVASFWLAATLAAAFGATLLLIGAVAVFVVAWIGQFIGHHIEGKRPSFLTDLVYLLIGPPWVLAKAYRKWGLRY